MRNVVFIFLVCLVSSCGVCKPVIVVKDSVRVVYRDRLIHDTIEIVLNREVERIVTRDTVSHLENSYAESDAIVSGGELTHSLKSFPKVIKVPVTFEVHDTTYVEKDAEVIEVERELTNAEKFWITFGKIAIGIVIGVLLLFAVKICVKLL